MVTLDGFNKIKLKVSNNTSLSPLGERTLSHPYSLSSSSLSLSMTQERSGVEVVLRDPWKDTKLEVSVVTVKLSQWSAW